MKIGLIERLLHAEVNSAGHRADLFQNLVCPHAVAFEIVTYHLNIDRRRQSEVQNPRDHVFYSFADRESDFIVDYCEQNQIAFFPWAPIGQAKAAHDALKRVASQFYATPIQIALAWLLMRSRVIVPIPGTGSVKHLEENVVAALLELSQMAYQTLSGLRPAYVSLRD
jgi:diketogulonate reductase-like aldo/keto reductase